MTFDIKLPDGIIQSIQITAEVFKTFSVWRIQFPDGKEAVLYHVGNEWLQRNEDGLPSYLLQLIGGCIDGFSETGLKYI